MASEAARPIVAIITGFGPFRDLKVNPSWLAVRALPALISTENGREVRVETYQLPVQYGQVREIISDMHARLNPDIVIHCGVSGRSCYCLESVAHSEGYKEPDNIGECPANEYPAGILESYKVDEGLLGNLVNHLNSTGADLTIPLCISEEAGRFLCEYSLFQSIRNATTGRICLFLHVPVDAPVALSTNLLYEIVLFLAQTQFTSR